VNSEPETLRPRYLYKVRGPRLEMTPSEESAVGESTYSRHNRQGRNSAISRFYLMFNCAASEQASNSVRALLYKEGRKILSSCQFFPPR
jgi:hypothetical protein